MTPSADTKASVRRFVELVWNEGRVDLVEQFVAADYLGHDQTGSAVAKQPLGVRKDVAAWRSAFPDLHVQIHDEVAEDDYLAIRWTASGTQLGEFQGRLGSGTRMSWRGISLFRLLAGMQVESWTYWDGLPAPERDRGSEASTGR